MRWLCALAFILSGSWAHASDIQDDFAYRQSVDAEAKAWVEDLMFMYKWSAKYPTDWRMSPEPQNRLRFEEGDVMRRLHSELAWLTVTGHGLVATYDAGADTTLAGSTSRFVSALMVSKSFWMEVRRQCVEIRELRKVRAPAGAAPEDEPLRTCAERFRRDLSITQFVGSNVSLFVGGGIVVGVGKRLFQRYAAKWVMARIVPFLPAIFRSRLVIGGTLAAIVIVPTAFVLAGVEHERDENRQYFDQIIRSLEEKKESDPKESILKSKALETERQVLEFALWIDQRAPHTPDGSAPDADTSRRFVLEAQMYGPNYQTLQAKRDELISRRESLEGSLAKVPDVTNRLRAIAAARAAGGNLSTEDARLFKDAQYLASLRMVLLFF